MAQVQFIKVGIFWGQQPANVMPAIYHAYDASRSLDKS